MEVKPGERNGATAMNLQKKITLLFTVLNFLLAVALGCSVYYTSKIEFIQNITGERWNLGEAVARMIEPEHHKGFVGVESLLDPQYVAYQQTLTQLIESFPNISYLYTLTYVKKEDSFRYVIDGEIVEENTVWLESEQLALEVSVSDSGEISVAHNAKEYTSDAEIAFADNSGVLEISFRREGDKSALFINDMKGFAVESLDPFVISTSACDLDETTRVTDDVEIKSGEKLIEFDIALSFKGQPASDPGAGYVDTPDVIQNLKEVLASDNKGPLGIMEDGAYGKFLVVYVPMKDHLGNYTSLVAIESDARVIDEFLKPIIRMACTVSLVFFVVMILCSFVLTHYIVSPIKKLTLSADKLADGDLDVRISIRRQDEIGKLAKSFDHMAHSLSVTQGRLKRVMEANRRFVPQSLLELVERGDVEDVRPGDNVEKKLTLLFADIRVGFDIQKTISEGEKFDLLNEALRIVSPVVLQNQGILAGYNTEVLSAIFPDDPTYCIEAALVMQREIDNFNELRKGQGGHPLELAVGIHTDTVLVGILGNEDRMDITMMSDGVSVVNELIEKARQKRSSVVISTDSFDLLERDSHLRTTFVEVVGSLESSLPGYYEVISE